MLLVENLIFLLNNLQFCRGTYCVGEYSVEIPILSSLLVHRLVDWRRWILINSWWMWPIWILPPASGLYLVYTDVTGTTTLGGHNIFIGISSFPRLRPIRNIGTGGIRSWSSTRHNHTWWFSSGLIRLSQRGLQSSNVGHVLIMLSTNFTLDPVYLIYVTSSRWIPSSSTNNSVLFWLVLILPSCFWHILSLNAGNIGTGVLLGHVPPSLPVIIVDGRLLLLDLSLLLLEAALVLVKLLNCFPLIYLKPIDVLIRFIKVIGELLDLFGLHFNCMVLVIPNFRNNLIGGIHLSISLSGHSLSLFLI